MDLLLRYIPWQIQVLILSIVVLAMIPNIIKMSKRVPKIVTVTLSLFTLSMLNLIFVHLGENMGNSIGITPKHVDILTYSTIVLFVLSMILIFIGRYQQVKHDEKERKHVSKEIRGVIISAIIFIIIILLAIYT